jgi:hypothetical protein
VDLKTWGAEGHRTFDRARVTLEFPQETVLDGEAVARLARPSNQR